MRTYIIEKEFLVRDGSKLQLIPFYILEDHIIEGVIQEKSGYWYPIINGVPCFLRGKLRPNFYWFQQKYNLLQIESQKNDENYGFELDKQLKTNITFSDKWKRFPKYGLERSHQEFLLKWYCKKFGFNSLKELKSFYASKKLILEVGCGSGFNCKFMAENTNGLVFGVDISEGAHVAFQNTKNLWNCHIIQADLFDLPFKDNFFDFIIADGVLHHTPDTKKALFAIYKKLKAGGYMFFYIYKKMGPIRQFCDQYIRDKFTKLSPDDCYKACEGLTELGRELSKLNAKITLKKGIPILGIQPGEYDVQRFVYYHFLKCFWNDAFDFDTNNMINYDWYHAYTAWQHTEEEVKEWLDELGVKEFSFNPANPNGISVLFKKPII